MIRRVLVWLGINLLGLMVLLASIEILDPPWVVAAVVGFLLGFGWSEFAWQVAARMDLDR